MWVAASATAAEITRWQPADSTGSLPPLLVTTLLIAMGLQ
jgi:hypothetical protein